MQSRMSAAVATEKTFGEKFIEIAQATDEEKADPSALFALYKENGSDIYYAISTPGLIKWITHETTAPRIREEVFMKIYEKRFPFDKDLKLYENSAPFIKALSQKDNTCATDTIFTILFEADALRPYFFEKKLPAPKNFPHDPEKCVMLPELAENLKTNIPEFELFTPHNASRNKYNMVLSLAKYRFSRMKEKNLVGNIEIPRSNSITNDMWKYSFKPLTSGEEGLSVKNKALFLGNVLVRNILEIPDLPSFSVRVFQPYKPIPTSITKDNLVAIILSLAQLKRISEDESMPLGHSIGFFKKDKKWFLIDNEIGYLHEFQDQVWFENIFLKRLFYTNEYPTNESGGDPSKKVYIQADPYGELLPFNIGMQFVTLGERSYPNVKFDSSQLPFDDSEINVQTNGIITITTGPVTAPAPAPAPATTGGGSAIAAAAVGGARRLRKTQRRLRQKTRQLRQKTRQLRRKN
jgi:hypothetical protein